MDTTLRISPGRVNLNADVGESKDSPRLPGFAYSVEASKSAVNDGIRGNFEKNPLNQAYFSPENFQINQNAIRKTVYDASGEIIDPVSTDDLFIVMRSLYLQYSRNLPTNIAAQIAELNARVTAFCVPKILSEVSMFKTYTKDISTLPVPLQHPQNINAAGTRTLPFKPFF